MPDPFYAVRGCISCRYLKYYDDPSTTICSSCVKRTSNIWCRNNWETCEWSPIDSISKEGNNEKEQA